MLCRNQRYFSLIFLFLLTRISCSDDSVIITGTKNKVIPGSNSNRMMDAQLSFSHTRNNTPMFKSYFPKKKQLRSRVIINTDQQFNYFLLLNNSEKDIRYRCQDGHIQFIQEALNTNNEWQPIEFWRHSTCGNSYFFCELESGNLSKFKIRRYDGEYKTKLRVKYKISEECQYGPEFNGSINLDQFIKPDVKYGISFLE